MKRLYKKIKQSITFSGRSISTRQNQSLQEISDKKVKEATQYVGRRFGRALVRLSDR